MAFNYTFTKAGAHGELSIPTVDVKPPVTDGNVGVKSTEWMVQIDDILSSFVEQCESYAELFGWFCKSHRYTTGDISNLLFTSSALNHSDVAIIIPNGAYAPTLEVKMNTGAMLKKINIVRIGNIGDLKIMFQQVTFEQCRIQSYEQQLDRLILTFNVTTRTNTVFAFGQDGKALGQTVSKVDYSKSSAAAG
jgi:hypothetical protein